MTCTVVEWLPVFTRPDAVQFLLDSWTHLRQHDFLSFPRSSVGTQFWTLQRPDLEQGHEPKPIRHPGTG